MSHVIVALPIADRTTSYAFYTKGLGFDAIGELADDGVPEPLQVSLNEGTHLMLIPSDGFGWVIGDREVAARGQIECLLNLGAATPAEVDAWIARARDAGAEVVTEPGQQPWGYAGTFADPDGHLWQVTAVGAGQLYT